MNNLDPFMTGAQREFAPLMDRLEEAEALLLEPRDVFDAAIIGITEGGCGPSVAVYDVGLCIEALMKANGWDYDEASEFFEFNTLDAYVGESTPVFVTRFDLL
jgi:hypothetical protein